MRLTIRRKVGEYKYGGFRGSVGMGILWEFPRVFSVGMGWVWELKFNSHGSPAYMSITGASVEVTSSKY